MIGVDDMIDTIVGKSQLARLLRETFTNVTTTGRVNLEVPLSLLPCFTLHQIDGWLSVSFCTVTSDIPTRAAFASANAIHPKDIRLAADVALILMCTKALPHLTAAKRCL